MALFVVTDRTTGTDHYVKAGKKASARLFVQKMVEPEPRYEVRQATLDEAIKLDPSEVHDATEDAMPRDAIPAKSKSDTE